MMKQGGRRKEKDFKISIITLSQILFFFLLFQKKIIASQTLLKCLSNSKLDNITISFLLHFLHYYFGSSHATLSLSPRSRPTITVTGLHFKGPFKKLNPNLYKSVQSSPLFLFLKIFVYFMLLAFASFCSLLLLRK